MSKDLETIRVLDDYLVVDITDRRVCEVSNPTYDRMFRGIKFANEMAKLLVEYRNRIAELQKQLAEKDKEIEELKRKVNYAVDDLRNTGMRFELETFRANKLQDELKSQPAEIIEKIRTLAEKDFDFDTCTCCGEDVHDDVVLTKNDFNKILENCLTVKN